MICCECNEHKLDGGKYKSNSHKADHNVKGNKFIRESEIIGGEKGSATFTLPGHELD